MPKSSLDKLRAVRKRAEVLNRTLHQDLDKFRNPADGKRSYVRLPTDTEKWKPNLNVTPTCTVLMAYAEAHRLKASLPEVNPSELLPRIYGEPWDTAGLEQNNAFTSTICLRTAATLMREGGVDEKVVTDLKRTRSDAADADPWRAFNGASPLVICERMLANPRKALSIHRYPANPAMGYWLIDAVDTMRVPVSGNSSIEFSRWASTEFLRQHSLVASQHAANMDPIALAMAACLCRRVMRSGLHLPSVTHNESPEPFPTEEQLRSAIRTFFGKQNQHGVWEKYLPFFHYPEAGANHCWHFEVLEAIFYEFPEIVEESDILSSVDLALNWLEANRLVYRVNDVDFSGWNSGSDLVAMRTGQPESWPTAVAHMCLARLQNALSEAVRKAVLEKYRDRVRRVDAPSDVAWENMLDSYCMPGKGMTFKRLLQRELLGSKGLKNRGPAKDDLVTAASIPDVKPGMKLEGKVSALVFGPPGTSKTSACAAIAGRLGWPFVELSPSDFLGGGLEGIYNKVDDVFVDLMDLYGVVILFDEMDALVQRRSSDAPDSKQATLDVSQQFLTTSMLPKLQRLHDRSSSLFFMATNYLRQFDTAITRSGRFDLLVYLGPPSLKEKVGRLHDLAGRGLNVGDVNEARALLKRALKSRKCKAKFELFTYAETTQFFRECLSHSEQETLHEAFEVLGKSELRSKILDWGRHKIHLRDKVLKQSRKDRRKTRVQ